MQTFILYLNAEAFASELEVFLSTTCIVMYAADFHVHVSASFVANQSEYIWEYFDSSFWSCSSVATLRLPYQYHHLMLMKTTIGTTHYSSKLLVSLNTIMRHD